MITKQIFPQVISQHVLVRQSSISILSQRTVVLVNIKERRAGKECEHGIDWCYLQIVLGLMPTILRQLRK